MAANNFRHALFCAIITLIISYPIIGFNLEAQGISVTLTGADTSTVVLVLLAAVVVFLFQLFRDQIMGGLKSIPSPMPKTQKEPMAENKRAKIESWVLTGIVVLALFWPFFVSRGAVDLATLVLIYVMLALGLNVVVGLAGLLDLGYVAFYAVGAYTFALLSQYAGISFWMALPIGACLAALFGLVLGFPVLRLRGDYLAIVTLGFGEIIRILLNNWTAVTGGPNGIGGIPDPTLFGMEFGRRVREEGNTSFHETFGIAYSGEHKVIFLYLIALVLAVITALIIRRFMRMPVGRAWEALREDEIAARSLGLSRTAVKLSAFTIGAFFAGFAGTVFASKQGFISPESFVFLESAIILAIVVLGGMGSQLGVVLAAVAVTILPELAREFSDYRMLVFGAAMVLMMVWRPQGLMPMRRIHIELRRQE
ncbi:MULTISPECIES: high-affinity branched-chain amino acid ABC transporter permease LivM [Marinobacter]|jgi:branched-chain amino acid transport system permease protein|uniref:L-isoleucine ABC transporter membrane protein / L-valine ABC transporter membrane protein / L-leucine ABC transporter membrane protein n=2 Tax=Marinobacter nauticus TaxID=2743 RepID=A1U5Y9_MARN8|nr:MULTISPECIES: high-affinity branched-chain amino acid ABC transporter permease LivM [Marinobacter]MCG8524241.1 high-affinity branched-chain amino acid ABC transporter permease LivM [Pseudomonadales bacterium]ABM20408.1 L-isoleucine ABC transporter membrane protein / L-valine ABC transporter membrane protein / L-leucine ABC transporter membrane protein [Marinobacter nauticus VT8]MBN8239230.1 high-affinity branched-chain amino acid ABC transporter permease LivM [Marinobacter nauticus]MBW319920